jgi:uncharacterized protein (TIGR03437 family)
MSLARSPRMFLVVLFSAALAAAPLDRVTRRVDTGRTRAIAGGVPRSAQPAIDRGAVDAAMRMEYMVLMTSLSGAQQAELDRLLADQQNPSSSEYHRWLTPEEFGARFGLSPADYSKVVAWLTAEGFTVNQTARGRNWVAFSGTAGQVSRSLETPIHRLEADGEAHFANTADPSVPEALWDVIGGFIGLDDFGLRPFARKTQPLYNSGSRHYLAPEDFATIYNVAPLYQAGFDGTGQSIAVVGQSNVLLSDIRTFRTRYRLPANDPVFALYGGSDPGYTSSEIEGDLDLEWAGAVAPKAKLYYIYGVSAFTAMVTAVNANLAPVVTVSYGNCEAGYRPTYYRSIAQQANAQGITILNSSGDSGAAGCDQQGAEPFATRGRMVDFPAVLPEVTGVGGTQFVSDGSYWAASNSASYGSALSYIPEAAWNESDSSGLISSGGGASLLYAQPAWQSGPGVPADGVRHVPDVSLAASVGTPYVIVAEGVNVGVGGTSASAPSLAGILALINQYQVAKGFQTQAGLGNINPRLYRLAETAPAVFHDVITGDNVVPCAQGSPDCLTGSFGYPAGAGYDLATGLGSVDANALATQWNTAARGVSVSLLANVSRASLNDVVYLTALVNPASGGGTPTGTVAFSAKGVPLGSSGLTARGDQGMAADLAFPAYLLGTGTATLVAEYSGDAAFNTGGAERYLQVTIPAGAAAIVPTWPNTVWPSTPDAQGLLWQTTLSLREAAGVPALITGFTIDGQAQPLDRYFPSPAIPASGTVSTMVVFRNLAAPVTRKFGFTGVDASSNPWSREVTVTYLPPAASADFSLTATPMVVAQVLSASPDCQWPVEVRIDELGGYRGTLSALLAGGVDLSANIATIFGTTRLDAWGSLRGVVCFSGVSTPGSSLIEVDLSSGVAHDLTVNFAGPTASATKLSITPAAISLAASDAQQSPQATLTIDTGGSAQPWTASIFPANRAAAWLTASKLAGAGAGQIVLSASGAGFEPGTYGAVVVIQSEGTAPQSVTVPVMFVLGPNLSRMTIGAVANAASYQPIACPGMTLAVFGSNLATSSSSVSGNPVPYATAGVSATVNGVAAPVLYVSPNQVNIQVPYEVGAGPAVLGIRNNGDVAGFAFQLAPAAPGIYSTTDATGNLLDKEEFSPLAAVSLLVSGVGEISPAIKTAYSPSTAASANSMKPVLPLSVTVGGVPAIVQSASLALGQPGTAQVTFLVPAAGASGPQPVVITVGGVASQPVTITVAPPAIPTTALK